MKKFWNAVKTRKITSTLIALVIILVGSYLLFGGKKSPNYIIAIAKRGTVTQEVSVNGRVKAVQAVDLAFEKIGRVSKIYVQVGDKVNAGQPLMSLYNDDIYAQLLQAKAGVESAQAKLDEMKKGTRPEQIQIKQSELNKAEQDLNNYYGGLINILNDSYTKADDAVRKQTDGLFNNDETDTPLLTYTTSNYQAQLDVQVLRVSARNELNAWKTELLNTSTDSNHEYLDQSIKNAEQHVLTIRNFLNRLSDTLEGSTNLSATLIDTYKYNVNLARTNVNTVATNITNQGQLISSQKLTIDRIEKELNLQLAGSTAEEIQTQEALVKQAQANAQNAEAQLEKTILRAPFNGIITRQNAELGQIISQNNPEVSVMSNRQFQVEANVPEVDIAKVKIGDQSKITLDAYGNDVIFEAKVVSIDPAETIVEGVATYKVTFEFIKEDDLIKSGMTANIDISTAKRDDVVYIPQRSVISNGQKTVKILGDNNNVTEAVVETGLRGSDGNIEITSGIKEGDKIIISEQ